MYHFNYWNTRQYFCPLFTPQLIFSRVVSCIIYDFSVVLSEMCVLWPNSSGFRAKKVVSFFWEVAGGSKLKWLDELLFLLSTIVLKHVQAFHIFPVYPVWRLWMVSPCSAHPGWCSTILPRPDPWGGPPEKGIIQVGFPTASQTLPVQGSRHWTPGAWRLYSYFL